MIKNCDQLLEAAVAKELLAQMIERARAAGWISDEEFKVHGMLLGWIPGELEVFSAEEEAGDGAAR